MVNERTGAAMDMSEFARVAAEVNRTEVVRLTQSFAWMKEQMQVAVIESDGLYEALWETRYHVRVRLRVVLDELGGLMGEW